MTPQSALVFAAGFGTRMAPLTDATPKPMLRVAGKPLLDHSLALLANQNLRSVVVNTHYLGDQIADHLQDRSGIECLFEPEILETGGGLKNALPALGSGPVFTLNSDIIFVGANPILALREAWRPEKMDALLILIPKINAIGHSGVGDFRCDAEGRLHRRGTADTAPFIYGGVQIIKTDRLKGIKETAFSLNVLWDEMLVEGRVFGLAYSGSWIDVGSPPSIALAEQVLANV